MRATGPKQTQRPGGMQNSNGDDGGVGTANQGEFCGSRGRDALAPRRIEDYPAAREVPRGNREVYLFFLVYLFGVSSRIKNCGLKLAIYSYKKIAASSGNVPGCI